MRNTQPERSLDNYKNKKQEYDRKIAEVQDKIEQSKVEEAAQSVVPGTVRAAAEQAEKFPARHETYGKYGIGLHRKCLCA